MRFYVSFSFLLLLLTQSDGLDQVCFVLNRLTIVSRDSIGVVSATSQVHCNIRCIGVPGCDACMYYEDRGNCVLLGVAKAPPPGTCGLSYTCYERRTSGCPVYSSPMVDRGYTPGPCSRLSDVVGPPTIGGNGRAGSKTCGNAREKVILELMVLLPQGRYLLFQASEMCSTSSNRNHSQITALSPACACIALPTVQPAKAGTIPHPTEQPRIDTINICATPKALIYYKRSINPASGVQDIINSNGFYSIYCAMGEWMNIYQDAILRNEASINAATCLQ